MRKTILVLMSVLTLMSCNERKDINTNKKIKVFNMRSGDEINVFYCDKAIVLGDNRVRAINGKDTTLLVSESIYYVEENYFYVNR